jgi:transposase
VADSALSSTENLQTLAKTGRPWIPRAPATITEAQDALAHADPETMEPLGEGYRYPMLASTYGGVPQRWMLCDSAQRRPQAQHSVDQPWRQQSEAAAQTFQTLCRTPFACEADASRRWRPLRMGCRLPPSTRAPSSRDGATASAAVRAKTLYRPRGCPISPAR